MTKDTIPPTKFSIDLLLTRMAETKGFPSLSSTVTEIIENLQSEEINLADIADTISADFSLTQKVLKLVNSSMYSSFTREIDTISNAVQLLGFDAISHLAVSLKILDAVALKQDTTNDVLNKTILASEVSKTLVADNLSEQASISTLIYNLGSLMISKFAIKEYKQIQELFNSGKTLDEACLIVLDMTYAQVGLEIAKKWKFPESLLGIIDGTGNSELLKIAQFSNKVSSLLTDNKLEELEQYKKDSESLGFNYSRLDSLIIEQEYKKSDRCERPVDGSELTYKIFSILEKYESTYQRFKYEVFSKDICTDLSKALSAQRVCILLATPHHRLKGSYGNDVSIEFSTKLDIDLQSITSIFNAVMLAKKDYYVADMSKFKKTMLPADLDLNYYNVQSFTLLPIVIRDKAVGLLYIDWQKPTAIGKEELVYIRLVRDLITPYVPRN